ncbi:hypothetical protein C2845_PM01G46930 [Panicum miliaceum]|uniref:Secreted protein n=1 Tax=Panicum miliaceum TaxID=4540 RepID=A0A3L6TT48_PANMI|nr:hypothetical protein C2845_PM01G46930 [Panicum miliaceum]
MARPLTPVAAFSSFICLASMLTLQPTESDANSHTWASIFFRASLHTVEGLMILITVTR